MRMTESDLLSFLDSEASAAYKFTDGDLGIDRDKALRAYMRTPYGNEMEGRSSAVSSDVFDAVEGMLPDLLEVFTASDKAVVFEPIGPEDVEMAEQVTDACNYVFYKKNNGFLILYTAIKDGLMLKTGGIKWYYETVKTPTVSRYVGADEMQIALFMQENKTAEIVQKELADPTPEDLQQSQMTGLPPPPRYTLKIRTVEEVGMVKVCAIPPEELHVSRKHNSITLDNCPYVAHVTKRTLSEVRQMGYTVSIDDINAAKNDNYTLSEFANERQGGRFGWWNDDNPSDETMQMGFLRDEYVLVDYDGDGIAERRRIVRLGDVILENSECTHVPIAAWTPYILTHQFAGIAVADLVEDFQRIHTEILRQQLDNLYLANNQETIVQTDPQGNPLANIDDLLNRRPGGVIRERVSGAVRPYQVQWQGIQAMPMIEQLSVEKENRTGYTRYSQGMDADSLNKMLDIHTEVPMADGTFRILRDIKDGDVIIGSEGKPVTVIKAHEIHEPERAYRMVFSSGDEIIAGGEHLWTIKTERDKAIGASRTVDTDDIYARTQNSEENIYIPRLKRPKFGGGRLPVNPYLLGCWLGDGTSKKSQITTMDQEVFDAFVSDGWIMTEDKRQNSGLATTWNITSGKAAVVQDEVTGRMVSTGNGWLGKIHSIGINGIKHIPDMYMRASYEDRLELLRGLMDTDGCHHSGALVIFSQKKGRLLEDVVRLIEGLGGWPSLSHQSRPKTGKEGQSYWNVTFHIFDNPFRLKRKAEKWRAPMRNVGTQPIVSITPIAIRPMRCLTVDAQDGLFCVGRRFTLTHNTARGMTMIMNASAKRMKLMARIIAEAMVAPMFKGIFKTLTEFGMENISFRLNGKFVSVNPQEWRDQYDMTINVGIGTGDDVQKSQMLVQIAQAQAAVAQSPYAERLLNPKKIYNVQARLAETAGFKNPGEFWVDPDSLPPAQPKQAPPDPKILLEQAKLQNDVHKTQAEMQIEQQQSAMELEFKRQEAELNRQHEVAMTELKLESAERIRAAELLMEQTRVQQESEKQQEQQETESAEDSGPSVTEMLLAQIQSTIATLAASNAAPKQVIRDENGNIIGIQSVQ